MNTNSQCVDETASLTLQQFFDSYYRPHRLLGAATKTAEVYQVSLRHFSRFLGRPPVLSDLNATAINGFLAWLTPGRRMATVWGNRKQLMSLASYAHRKGFLPDVPEVVRVKHGGSIPTAYNVEDISRLICAAGEVAGDVGGVPARLFWPALFLTVYDTGARAGATWELRWEDYQPDIPALLFRAETQKQAEDQLLKISPKTAEAIEAIRLPARDVIFDWPGCQRMKYIWIRTILQAAGLPCGRRDQLQRIRRTTATLMYANGGDACWQLGHSSDAITRQHYLDPSSRQQAADVLPRPNGNGHAEPVRRHNPTAEVLRRQAEELLAMAKRMEEGSDAV